MVYLEKFKFPTLEEEEDYRWGEFRTCFDTYYPFFTLSKHQFEEIDFEPITILYGGNGSGKSTALNVIAEKLKMNRDTLYNRSNFYEDYLAFCKARCTADKPEEMRIVTSDDVFDFMLNLRGINQGIDLNRELIMQEYAAIKYGTKERFRMKSLDDYDELKKVNSVRKETMSKFVRNAINGNVREHSNGESAILYFEERIKDNGLYLLDEPENSLSPKRQLELAEFLESSERYFGCQFVIATHSPFLLALRGAKVYDLDDDPVYVKDWRELESIQIYSEFFKKHF